MSYKKYKRRFYSAVKRGDKLAAKHWQKKGMYSFKRAAPRIAAYSKKRFG